MRHFLLFCFFSFQLTILLAQDKQARYERVDAFVEGMAMVSKDGKYGFINRAYQEVIPPVYLTANDFSDGLAVVEVEDSLAASSGASFWIFIDKSGKQAIPDRYEDILYAFSEGLAVVRKGDKRMVIDKKGEVVMDVTSNLVLPFKHGMVEVMTEKGKVGVINLKGEPVVPSEYDVARILSPTLIMVSKDSKDGFFSNKGKRLTKLVYEEIEPLRNGFVAVKQNEKWGLVNKEGKEIVAPQYDEIENFHDGLARVEKKEKMGFIDEAGKVVIPVKLDWAGQFLHGKTNVTLNNSKYYIDKRGNPVDEDYIDIGIVTDGLGREDTEKLFLDFLNRLIKEYPYEGSVNEGGTVSDSLFTIRNGVLSGSFKKHTFDEVVLEKIAVPVSKITHVWYDYNLGLGFDGNTAIVQSTKPGGAEFSEQYETDVYHLSTLGDGDHGQQWQAKLEVVLKALKRFYK